MATYYPHGVNVDAGDLQLGGVAVTATAAELNKIDGAAGSVLGSDVAGKQLVSIAGTAITGAGTIGTGLSAISNVVASLVNVGTGAGDPFIVTAGTAAGGSVVVSVWQDSGSAATNAGTVNLLVYG